MASLYLHLMVSVSLWSLINVEAGPVLSRNRREVASTYPKYHGTFIDKTGCQGYLSSPGAPAPYLNGSIGLYIITVPSLHTVKLTIQQLDIEDSSACSKDSLTIHDGPESAYPQLAKLCGQLTGAQSLTFTSSSNYLFLRFTADQFGSGHGFVLEYSAVPMPGVQSKCADQVVVNNGCLGAPLLVTGGQGYVSSVGYPEKYENYLHCSYAIDVSGSGTGLTVSFIDIDIESHSECKYDYVQIYLPASDAYIGPFCGHITPEDLSFDTTLIYVIFHSDYSINRSGFKLQFLATGSASSTTSTPSTTSHIPSPITTSAGTAHPSTDVTTQATASTTHASTGVGNLGCSASGLDISDDFGRISSPNYPSSYPDGLDCVWIITVPFGFARIRAHEFSLESSTGCVKDFLEVYDVETGAKLGKFCGDDMPSVVATGQSIKLVFHTDSHVTGSGYEIDFDYIDQQHQACQRTATLAIEDNSQVVVEYSGSFSSVSSGPVDCSWLVVAPANRLVQLSVLSLSVSGSNDGNHCSDSITVYDITSGSMAVVYCGTSLPGSVVLGQSVFITYHQASSSYSNYFKLIATAVAAQTTRPTSLVTTTQAMTTKASSPQQPTTTSTSTTTSPTVTTSAATTTKAITTTTTTPYTSTTSTTTASTSATTSPTTTKAPSTSPTTTSSAATTTKAITTTTTYTSTSSTTTASTSTTTTASTTGSSTGLPVFTMQTYGDTKITNVAEGYILSPSYPSNYPSGSNSKVFLTQSTVIASRVFYEFSALTFDVEPASSGCYDKLYITHPDLSNAASNITYGPLCGLTTASFPNIKVEATDVVFIFTSDSIISRAGFKIHFKVTVPITTPASVNNSTSSQCGVPSVTPCFPVPSTNDKCATNTIVGGQHAQPYSYPWQVALVDRLSNMFCGGSIVHPEWIVTAAHCVYGWKTNELKIKVGIYELDEPTPLYSTQEIRVHPQYDSKSFDNDVALIKLSQPLVFGGSISAVCLATSADLDYSDEAAVVTGWGRTAEFGSISYQLKEAQVTIRTQTNCTKSYENTATITDSMMCAGSPGQDSCQGDSGGPLVIRQSSNAYKLVGVVSWGNGCADPSYPGVYTRISSVYHWIQQFVL